MPITAEALSNLIGSIYDCALDPGRWSETLDHLRIELDFANASLSLLDLTTGALPLHVSTGMDSLWLERMPQYGADIVELWGGAERIQSYPLDEPTVLSRVRHRSEWENNRYYAEWGRPQGLIDTMAIVLARDAAAIGNVGFGRHESAGMIGDLEVDAGRLLLPHLCRAVAITRLLDVKSVMAATFETTLDTLTVAVLLVEADLRIVHANASARAMLPAGDPIGSRRGVLTVRRPMAAAALGVAVRQAAENEAAIGKRGFGIPAARADGAPSVLHVLPLRRGALRLGLSPAAAAIFVAPATLPPAAPSEALAALFDLTAAEARIFERIAAGETQSAIARMLGVERSTVKTHLLRIFTKTGTRRQADVVRLGASLALPVQ